MPTQLKQKKWRYKPSQKLRKHIEQWEGSDFAKQNKQFGGDAIAAKAIEFSNIMGNRGKYFTQNELDGMFSTYYNLAPDTFNQRFMSLIDNYVNDTSPQNLQALKDSMADRWVLAKNIHKRGIRNRAASDVSLMGDGDYGLPDSRTALFPLQKSIKQSQPEVHIAQPDALVVDKPILPIKQPAQTAYSAPNQQEVYDIFNDAAVAYGNESMLPSINDLLKEGKTKYFANILGMPSLYDQDSSGYDVRPFLVAKNGKLPRFEDGEVPDSTWHEEWLKQREPQFNENLNSASGQQNIFQQYGTDSIKGQLNNLKSARVYTDSESFNNSVPDSEKLTSFARKSLLGGGEVRQGINGNNSIYLDPYSNGWVKTHEYTHALSRVPDLSDPNHQIDIMTPQDAKFAQIVKEAELNNSLYADPSNIYNNEYDIRPNEKTSEIYAFRQKNKLNPKKKVTDADIEKWRKEDLIPYSLNKYSNDALVRMFNDIAYVPNQPKGDIVYAKNGKLPRLKPKRR